MSYLLANRFDVGASCQGVADVAVAQPVGADVLADAGACGHLSGLAFSPEECEY